MRNAAISDMGEGDTRKSDLVTGVIAPQGPHLMICSVCTKMDVIHEILPHK